MTPATGLTIIGCGIDPSRHLTLEADAALRAADDLLTLMPSGWVGRLPGDLAPRVRSLFGSHYTTGRDRRSVYNIVTDIIVDAATSSQVAYLVQGGPSWYDSVVDSLLTRCDEEGIPCRLVAGVSAVEAVITSLHRRIAPGLVIADAASLITGCIRPEPALPLLVVQPHVGTTALVASGYATPMSTVAALGQALANHYPGGHEVHVTAVAGEWESERRATATVEALAHGVELDLRGASLFLDPVREALVTADGTESA